MGIMLDLTHGNHGVHLAGPDLLDYVMIFMINGGDYSGDRLRVESSFHPCCGTLEIKSSLMKVYRWWKNNLIGCNQHHRKESGDQKIREIIRNLSLIIRF